MVFLYWGGGEARGRENRVKKKKKKQNKKHKNCAEDEQEKETANEVDGVEAMSTSQLTEID